MTFDPSTAAPVDSGPPAQVPVGKKQAGVLAALAMSPADQANNDRLEATPEAATDYASQVSKLKPPRSPAEATAQADLRAHPPPASSFDPSTAQAFDPASAQPVKTLHGFDAIPRAPGAPPVAAPPPPAPEPSLSDKVLGGIEAGLNIVTSLTSPTNPYQPTTETGKQYAGTVTGAAKTVASIPGQALGIAGGTIGGIAGALATGQYGTQQGAQNVEQSATEGAQTLTPQALAPSTPAEEQGAEAVGDVMNAAAPVLGHAGEMSALHAGAAPVTRMVGDATRAGGAAATEAVGKAGTAVAKGVGKAIGVDPELAKVAQIAGDLKYPLDVRPDQVVGSAKYSKMAGEASSDVPLSGSKNDSNRVAFTKNVIDAINPDETEERLTPAVFADAMNRSGQGIGDITAKTPVPLEDINSQLEALRDHVDTKHSDETAKTINAYIDEIQSKAGDDGTIDGTVLKSINSEIGERARSEADSPLGGQLNDLQAIIQDGVEKNIADPADAKALRDYRRQYAYGKIIEPLVAGTIDGNITPSSLIGRVNSTKLGKHLMATGKAGPLGDLAKVGKLVQEPKSSGTAERSFLYGVATDVGKAAKGTVLYPAANVYNRLGPKLTRAMVGERPKAPGPVEPEPFDPSTSPGAGGPGGGGGPPAGPGPLGDLTPDWTTAPGAGGGGAGPAGGPPGGPAEPGLVRALDEAPPTTGNRKAPLEVPAVPGRPDLPDTLVSGGPAETAATEPSNAAMNEPGAIEARRQQSGAAARQSPAQGPSIAEAQRLLAENPSPEVRKVLEDHIEAAKQLARDRAAQEAKDAQAAQIERTARTTTDPVIQKKLIDEANKLRGAEPIPVGETREGQPPIEAKTPTKPLPVGKVIEGEPAAERVPVGKATEKVLTEQEWRDQFKLGDDDAERAKAVAQALQHDPEAVEKAAVQHEKSPRAFDRVIQEINDANEAKPPPGGGEGVPAAAAEPGETVRPGEGGAPVRGEPAGDAVPAAERGAEGVAQPEPGAAVPAADEHAGADSVPAAGPDSVSAAGGRQDAGGQENSGAAGVTDLRGYGYAIVKDGKLVESGTLPSPKFAAADETTSLDYFKRKADAAGGDLYVGGYPDQPAWTPPTDRIFGMTWDELKARQQRGRSSAPMIRKMPTDAVRVYEGKPNDTSTTGPGDADRVRGQGQTPLKGELSDEAFQVEKKSLAQKAVGDNFDRDKAVAALPEAVRNDPLFRPEKAGARDVGASDAVWQKLQDFSRQEGLPDYSLNADDLGNVIVGKPLSPDQFAKVAKYADDNDLGVYVLKNAAGEDVADVKAMRAAGFESAQGLGLYGNGRHVESSIPPGRAAYVYKPRGFSEFLFRSGEASAKPFNNAAELESHLREQLGNKLIDGLQAQGLLRFANSEAEGRRGARGMMKQNINELSDMSDTHATLFYNMLAPGDAAGTLMHELGEHFGMIRLLGKDRYKVFLNEVRELGKSSDPEIKAAWDDVADRYVLKPTDKGDAQFMGGNRANPLKYADTSNPNFLREVAAKLIETKPDLPFVRRVINDIRVFFYTHFGTTLGSSVDASLIRGLGAAALRKAGEGKLEGQTATAKLALAAKSYAPMVAKRSDGFPPLYTQ